MITPYTLSKVRLFKAILPIMIVLHHLSFFYGFPPGFARLGIPLVACFFLMSGYGLMTSYQSKGLRYFDGFIWHISKKLLMPYLLAIIAYIPLVLVVQRVDLTTYLSETNFLDWLRYSWFVFVIWGGYLLFYIIFRSNMTYCKKLGLYAFFSILYYIVSMSLLEGRLPFLYRTSYAIFLGFLWKYKEESILTFLKKKYVLPIVFSLSVVGFVFTVKTNDLLWNPLFSVLLFICTAYIIPLNKDYPIIKLLSKISYEYYLWQGLTISLVIEYWHFSKMAISLCLCLSINALLSLLAHYFYNRIICQNLEHPRV